MRSGRAALRVDQTALLVIVANHLPEREGAAVPCLHFLFLGVITSRSTLLTRSRTRWMVGARCAPRLYQLLCLPVRMRTIQVPAPLETAHLSLDLRLRLSRMRRAGEHCDARLFPAAPGGEEDERAGSTEPPVLEKDSPFRQVLKSIRDYHGFPTPLETTPHPDRSAMARHLGLPLDHAPALHLPASQLTKALIDYVNSHMRKFGEDQTQGAFLPIPGRRSRRFYRTSEPLFPAPYQIPPGVAPLVQESSTDIKRRPTTYSPSLSSSQEVLLSSACETASWIDLALPACSNFGSRLPADSNPEFERMMLSVGRAVEFLASQVVTALGNHVLAKRDSLLRDPQSTVPVEALSRLRHASLPSSSAAIFPVPLLDDALSKSRASANDLLVKKSLHPRGFLKRHSLTGQISSTRFLSGSWWRVTSHPSLSRKLPTSALFQLWS